MIKYTGASSRSTTNPTNDTTVAKPSALIAAPNTFHNVGKCLLSRTTRRRTDDENPKTIEAAVIAKPNSDPKIDARVPYSALRFPDNTLSISSIPWKHSAQAINTKVPTTTAPNSTMRNFRRHHLSNCFIVLLLQLSPNQIQAPYVLFLSHRTQKRYPAPGPLRFGAQPLRAPLAGHAEHLRPLAHPCRLSLP